MNIHSIYFHGEIRNVFVYLLLLSFDLYLYTFYRNFANKQRQTVCICHENTLPQLIYHQESSCKIFGVRNTARHISTCLCSIYSIIIPVHQSHLVRETVNL